MSYDLSAIDITTVSHPKKQQTIKCVIWDLDNTLWNGVLLEDDQVTLRPEVAEVIKILDSRGILHSISSRNDAVAAMAKLEQFGLKEYFLYPQINWNSKSSSIQIIAQALNISIDTLAFVDDQAFEREEVAFFLPEVLCINEVDAEMLPNMIALQPRFITEDSKLRRQMYVSDIERSNAKKEFVGSEETFLATLNMVFTIKLAEEEDLKRIEELTIRTHQLNTTGYTYSYEELDNFRSSESHQLLISELTDKYGSYGKIGLSLIECQKEVWTIKLLLMSCRVMSRGVGTIMMNHLIQLTQNAQVRLQAEFLPNDRNRMMYVTYKFAGFREVKKVGELSILECDLSNSTVFPDYVQVNIEK
jgi:FkbH-like protein